VTAETLSPRQCPTPQALKKACDFRQQCMLKHSRLSDFHSLAEHLHAGLLEGDSAVSSYIPQPFRLRVRGIYYTPDCYIVDGNRRRILEINPTGEIPDDRRIPLEQFFKKQKMRFEVVSNQSIYARRIEAENWLEIVRLLYVARDLDTQVAEQTVLEFLYRHTQCEVGDLVDSGDRERTYNQEIALFRLLHRGILRAALTDHHLDYDTAVSLCH
jgi:hypothetical protein